MNGTIIEEKLDKIATLLKIIAKKNLDEIKQSLLSTPKKEQIFELCDGNHELAQIAKEISVSNEYVRITVRDLEESGVIILKKEGRKFYPVRMV